VWKADLRQGPRWYFLDCPEITDVVYPCAEDAPPNTYDTNAWAERQRLKHSWLVGRGALAVAKAIGFQPDVVVMSETPPCSATPNWSTTSWPHERPLFAESRCVFNDHTPLEYAHPIWPQTVLDTHANEPRFYGPLSCGTAKSTSPKCWSGEADGAFGVAEKHARVMRAMPSLKPQAAKIQHVTNGVQRGLLAKSPLPWRTGSFGRYLLDCRQRKVEKKNSSNGSGAERSSGPTGPKKSVRIRWPFGPAASPATSGWTFWNAFSRPQTPQNGFWTRRGAGGGRADLPTGQRVGKNGVRVVEF
jgi:hypothetical protein